MDSGDEWPLETRLVTVFKVDSFDVYHHTSRNPYFQISVGGFVLDGWGEKVSAGIELNAEDGDTQKVREFEVMYSVGSIHRLDTSLFGAPGGCFQFYAPESEPVPPEKYAALNKIFLSCENDEKPLESIELNNIAVSSIASLSEQEDGSLVRIICQVTGLKEISTKQGAVMAFAAVRDWSGESDITIFSDIYAEVSDMIKSGVPLTIAGRLQIGEGGATILLSGPLSLVSDSGSSLPDR